MGYNGVCQYVVVNCCRLPFLLLVVVVVAVVAHPCLFVYRLSAFVVETSCPQIFIVFVIAFCLLLTVSSCCCCCWLMLLGS